MQNRFSARSVFLTKNLVLTAGLLLLVHPPIAHNASRDSSPVKRILILGDSLSDGFRLKRSEAYPALLTDKLRAAGLEYEVMNASQSGGTTEGGLARLPAALKHRVDIFILELGINDAFRGLAIDEIRRNLQAIIDQVKAQNPEARIVILGMQLPDHSSDDYVSEFGKVYSELATKNRAALLPYLLQGVAGDPALNLPDGIHPNGAGHKVLAENVWKVLEPVARETAENNRSTSGPARVK
jgi:acyl-CoA thioesterase I